ncbi:hypothetical protein H4R34_004005 [Dimargaris verticillata]|uniref:N-acetyltransferase domain-containing protein n=1 Tax=Dimargaris verticillata TaxID=2761393 RepID=A0A9W8E8J4_9FUNG|nr:hypothetical protein H4R34_004005 [Dimargaris verticillata]
MTASPVKQFPYELERLSWIDAEMTRNIEHTYCYCGADYAKVVIVQLVLYHFTQTQPGTKFFQFKDAICSFIDRHWSDIQPNKKRATTWRNTISAVLSTHPSVFVSGLDEVGQPGFWGLKVIQPPDKLPFKKEIKPKSKLKAKPASPSPAKTPKPQPKLKHKEPAEPTQPPTPSVPPTKPTPKPAVQSVKSARINEGSKAAAFIVQESAPSKALGLSHSKDMSLSPLSMSSLTSLSSCSALSSPTDSELQLEPPTEVIPKDPPSALTGALVMMPNSEPETTTNNTVASAVESLPTRKRGLSDTADAHPNGEQTSVKKLRTVATLASEEMALATIVEPRPDPSTVTLMSPEEMAMWYETLQNMTVPLPPKLARLRRKLRVRCLQSRLGLDQLNMEAQVVQSLEQGIAESSTLCSPGAEPIAASNDHIDTTGETAEPIIQSDADRHTKAKVAAIPYYQSFASRLYGQVLKRHTLGATQAWTSPFLARKLKPFIRRDYETTPTKLKLLEQIARRDGATSQPRRYPIDYCYFQQCHLEQVNALLSRAFWPDIDMNEALLNPEYSVVVLYKRLVIGCAFMTPDAYLTYITVAPGWEGAGIGSFMLYHLNQVSVGKDITLHVSANNPAMILYQGYGFKPEQFIVNFYDKYLPEDSRLSKNAFLLRLRR